MLKTPVELLYIHMNVPKIDDIQIFKLNKNTI